jgi:hypothetical protein
MRLSSPQLAMPNLQPRSFQHVAHIDTQREGAKRVKVNKKQINDFKLTRPLIEKLEEKFKISNITVYEKAIQLIKDGRQFSIILPHEPTSFEDISALLTDQLTEAKLKTRLRQLDRRV